MDVAEVAPVGAASPATLVETPVSAVESAEVAPAVGPDVDVTEVAPVGAASPADGGAAEIETGGTPEIAPVSVAEPPGGGAAEIEVWAESDNVRSPAAGAVSRAAGSGTAVYEITGGFVSTGLHATAL